MNNSTLDKVLILDFGSQYTQLIARRIREQKVYCEIHPFKMSLAEIEKFGPKAIVLSGGPTSVYGEDSPLCDKQVFFLGVPVLGICYGMQLMSELLGGQVSASSLREYGRAVLKIEKADGIFEGFDPDKTLQVWMSHGDKVDRLPDGFEVLATSHNSPYAAVVNFRRNLYAVQFHPEVVHTPRGKEILGNFLFKVAGCNPGWTMSSFIERSSRKIKEMVGDQEVICALSGGVDSSVVAALLNKAIGEQLRCIFVNNGLLRKGEFESVVEVFNQHFGIDLVAVDASDRFLQALAKTSDPEQKRKTIGELFINVFEEEAKKFENAKFLAQGTLYPDVIESTSVRGPSATIKSHHNVGGLPEYMKMELIEPLRELFKDEVRDLGRELGLPENIVERQPFPGPGLGIRVVGEITKSRLETLREADYIFQEELVKSDCLKDTWQSLAVLLPVRSVGVMGDERTFEETVVLRAVTSVDGMTADWARLPDDLLARVSNRIINEIKGVNRVLYDISSKPPATIEWE
jgi:GMP synthase (glutamine-hydrolysing)